MDSLCETTVEELIDKCAGRCSEGAHFDVAMVTHWLYKDCFKYVDKKWRVYSIEYNEWIQSNISELDLRFLLSTEVALKFMERSTHWAHEAVKTQDEERRATFENRKQKLLTLSTLLKKDTYKKYVINECKCLFR